MKIPKLPVRPKAPFPTLPKHKSKPDQKAAKGVK